MKENMTGAQGKPKQIKDAEKLLEPAEKKASEIREKYLAKWKEAGINGEIYAVELHNLPGLIIKGTIDGHKWYVDINTHTGEIDGRRLNDSQAGDLWRKYHEFAAPLKYANEAKEISQGRFKDQQRENKKFREDEGKKTQALVDELLGDI